ncbi:MAG: hypothetical protein K1000chlam3_01341 [Chlamydiae bacterium]|nr:hypothetical protein [Chlamydiota bacterium]
MKLFVISFTSLLMTATFLLAASPNKKGCGCKDCKCTQESHCGCLSEKGCSCSNKACPSNEKRNYGPNNSQRK